VTKAQVRANVCYDNRKVKTQLWGLQIGVKSTSSPSDLVVWDNDFQENLRGGIGSGWDAPGRLVSTGFGSWGRNIGYRALVTTLDAGRIPCTSDVVELAVRAPS